MEVTAKDHSTLKFFLLVVLAVVLGSILFNWGSEEAQRIRRRAYAKAHPGAVVQTAPVAQVIAGTSPDAPAPTAPATPVVMTAGS